MQSEPSRLKIAFLTETKPQDRRQWSGTTYRISQALQRYCGDVTFIGPLPVYKAKLYERILNKSSKLLLKKKYFYQHGISTAKWYGKIASGMLEAKNFDVIIVAEGTIATMIAAFLKTDIPVFCIHDATFALLYDYYSYFSNLLGQSMRELNTLEALTFKKVSAVIYSSAWAANSAIADCGANPGKIYVVPFGANLDSPPTREVALTRQKLKRCRLLFLGVEWDRKGGDIAFETLLKLEAMGIEAELIVCGCIPPRGMTHDHMKLIPFLNKNDEKQHKELEQLLLSANFLLIPTRADCTPIVFCEAAAFGLPIVSTNTGGISEIIKDGENGFLLPLEARGEAYAEVIAEVYRDDERYAQLVRSSRAAFEERLNWDAWGVAVKHILADLLEHENSDKKIASHQFNYPR